MYLVFFVFTSRLTSLVASIKVYVFLFMVLCAKVIEGATNLWPLPTDPLVKQSRIMHFSYNSTINVGIYLRQQRLNCHL
jgi:hypothetical protein